MQFDNEYFEKWLDERAAKAMEKITNGETYEQIDVMLLVLKAQTNHMAHMERDLHGEMRAMRGDIDKRFEHVDKRFEHVDKSIEQVEFRFQGEIRALRDDMDKRFELVDRRLNSLDQRMDSFMKWSLSCTLIVGGLVVAAIEMLK